MRILLTGATGFVGRRLVEALNALNSHSIMIVSRDLKRSKSIFNGISCEHIDINELCKIKDFNPELVFHLASMITSQNNKSIIEELINSNITFGVRLLDALKECNLKYFINIGTFAEYRLGTDSISNAYFYSATKTSFKQFVDYYSNLCGYNYVHIVPYTIYGNDDSQKKIMDYIIDSFSSKEAVKMSQGEQILDFIHINDVVSFFVYITQNLSKISMLNNGEVLFLGTGKGTSIRELSSLLEKKYNKKANIEWGALPYRDMDVMHAVAPISKLIALGWKPVIQLEEGLESIKQEK